MSRINLTEEEWMREKEEIHAMAIEFKKIREEERKWTCTFIKERMNEYQVDKWGVII